MAGFQVSMHGRFWVSTEDYEKQENPATGVGLN